MSDWNILTFVFLDICSSTSLYSASIYYLLCVICPVMHLLYPLVVGRTWEDGSRKVFSFCTLVTQGSCYKGVSPPAGPRCGT